MISEARYGRLLWICMLFSVLWSIAWQPVYAEIDFSPRSCAGLNTDDDYFSHPSSDYLMQRIYDVFVMGAVPTELTAILKLDPGFKTILDCTKLTKDGHCTSSACSPSTEISFYIQNAGGMYSLAPEQEQWITIKSIGVDSHGAKPSPSTVLFRSILDIQGNICVQALLPTGFKTLGCKPYGGVVNVVPTASTKPCYLSESCYDATQRVSHMPNPMASLIVQCFTETLQNLFFNSSSCSHNILATMQVTLRTAVMAALALYVILFGIKTMMGQEPPRKAEIFIFIIKMVLVIYFSIGFVSSNPDLVAAGGAATNHGLVWLYNTAISTSIYLGNLFLQTGQSSGLCQFGATDYKAGYEYMALWDGLDCRLAYYFGFVEIGGASQNTPFSTPGLFGMFFPMFFGSLAGPGAAYGIGVLLLILLFITITLIVSFAFFVINLYLVAFLAVAMLIFLAPLFVPMVLFQSTRQYYDSWKSLLLGYALQPAIFLIVLGMFFSILDAVIYQDCTFINSGTTGSPLFTFVSPSDTCMQTLGYQMATYEFLNNGLATFFVLPLIIFNVPVLMFTSPPFFMIGPVVTACFFAYLFYYFADVVNNLLGDLTGAGSLGSFAALKPTSVLDGVGKAAEAGLDWVAGKKMEGDNAPQNRTGVEGPPLAGGSGAPNGGDDKGKDEANPKDPRAADKTKVTPANRAKDNGGAG
jgi:type IV secretion system protein VirB6